MNLTWRRQRLRLRHRFTTAQGAAAGGGLDEKETLVVQLEHAGIIGLGEAAPSALYGQSLEASEQALGEMRELLGDDPFLIEPIVQRLLRRHDGQRAAVAGVETALHDWVGKKLGLPVWRWLGLDPPRVPTTFTIGIAAPAEIRVKTREALDAGFRALKVKVGAAHDHETLSAIREVFDGPLLLDANQAWTPAEAADKIRALARFRPVLIEQPLRKDDWPHLAALRELRVAPIFADESCERPADVVKLRGCVDGVNIKFTKCGGVREALRMIALARVFEMQVMLGCFVSSSLALAPALALASLVDFADLDGHLLLAADPFAGISCAQGVLELGERPGLGVHSVA